MKICVSLAETSWEACRKSLETVEFAEIRLDITPLTLPQTEALFASPSSLIATFRPAGADDETRRRTLESAIAAGADYVDLESDAEPVYRDILIRSAREKDCRIIVSYHDEAGTPARTELLRIIKECRGAGADIVKIACRVHSQADCARLLSLYENESDLISLGIGNRGRFTRLAALWLGAPFTYAALTAGKETAEGQIDIVTMKTILAALPHV